MSVNYRCKSMGYPTQIWIIPKWRMHHTQIHSICKCQEPAPVYLICTHRHPPRQHQPMVVSEIVVNFPINQIQSLNIQTIQMHRSRFLYTLESIYRLKFWRYFNECNLKFFKQKKIQIKNVLFPTKLLLIVYTRFQF